MVRRFKRRKEIAPASLTGRCTIPVVPDLKAKSIRHSYRTGGRSYYVRFQIQGLRGCIPALPTQLFATATTDSPRRRNQEQEQRNQGKAKNPCERQATGSSDAGDFRRPGTRL